MHLDNEGWALCPVKSNFKVSNLKEFRSSTFSQKISPYRNSPRKSVKNFVMTSNTDDFVSPFDNFLDESILEEDFMLHDEVLDYSDEEDNEELQGDFIDDGGSATAEEFQKSRQIKTPFPVLTNTSLMLLRLWGKYLHLLQMLEPISDEVFLAMTNLMDFYLFNVYQAFTKDLVSK